MMRVSSAGSCSATAPPRAGSFHGLVTTPSPLVSSTVGHQPCDACSSPVSSYIFVSSQPMTCPPPLKYSVSLSSSANCRWWVPKQVWMSSNSSVSGS